MANSTITWTIIDEAPALATHSLLPILRKFTKSSQIEFEERDISLSGRIIANLSDQLKPEQRIDDHLSYLGSLVKTPGANVIKLPNISASISQLKAAIKELQSQGYDLPEFPEDPDSDMDKKIRSQYAKVLGSAVNPVLREGNSDRRAAVSVKQFAQKNPHKMMKPWESGSKSHVAHMSEGDFYGSEKSTEVQSAIDMRIEFVDQAGDVTTLKEKTSLQEKEIIDASVMSAAKLRQFFTDEIADAKSKGILFSLHMKATMMKISDPMIFGHAVSVYFQPVFEKHAATFEKIGVNPDLALVDLYAKLGQLPDDLQKEIEADIIETIAQSADLAMVDSDKGITNLHATNDIIIDASMPVVIRDGGRMYNKDGELQDVKAVIPDRSYATMYQAVIEDCQSNGALDPSSIGAVSNVGLMAQKAEEYGSHDKTFRAPGAGTIRAVDSAGNTLLEQTVEQGDIFRMSQTKDEPIKDWVRLAVSRARATGAAAVFWLDENRAHDAQLIRKVNEFLKSHDTSGLTIETMAPREAMVYTLARSRRGEDTISVTGNVLRDYLTDLFPILELGTSAKMLSVVPLLKGGGLFETGAGGSAPKHVQQFLEENHLRWDSLGEFCALVASLEHLAETQNNAKAAVLAKTLDQAISGILENSKSPSRKAGQLDNRGSHYYLALYWAKALAAQGDDGELKAEFEPLAAKLAENEQVITSELVAGAGQANEIGGYYLPNSEKAAKAMRPSATFNSIIDG